MGEDRLIRNRVQLVKAVQILLAADQFIVFLILKLALLIDLVLEVLMGL